MKTITETYFIYRRPFQTMQQCCFNGMTNSIRGISADHETSST